MNKKNNYTKVVEYNDLLVINHPLKGNCLISKKNYCKDDVILISPVILIPNNESANKLYNLMKYVYYWEEEKKNLALTPSVSLYLNHCLDANTDIKRDKEKLIEVLFAAKDIKKGDELTIDYYKLDFCETLDFEECSPLFIDL